MIVTLGPQRAGAISYKQYVQREGGLSSNTKARLESARINCEAPENYAALHVEQLHYYRRAAIKTTSSATSTLRLFTSSPLLRSQVRVSRRQETRRPAILLFLKCFPRPTRLLANELHSREAGKGGGGDGRRGGRGRPHKMHHVPINQLLSINAETNTNTPFASWRSIATWQRPIATSKHLRASPTTNTNDTATLSNQNPPTIPCAPPPAPPPAAPGGPP